MGIGESCVVAESSRHQVDSKDSTRNQAVIPCLFFGGMGMVRLSGRARAGACYFLLGPTGSLDRRKGASEGMQHRDGV